MRATRRVGLKVAFFGNPIGHRWDGAFLKNIFSLYDVYYQYEAFKVVGTT